LDARADSGGFVMQRIRSCEVSQHVGSRIRLHGWLSTRRRLGGIAFLVLRDGWGSVQVTADADALAPLERANAGPESVLEVVGEVRENPKAPGGLEIVEPSIEVLVAIGETLPVPLGRALANAKLPALLDHAPTTLRDPSRRAVFELAAGAMAGFRRRLGELGFTEIQTPKVVRSASEGGANVFALDWFGSPAYLAQSPQLYKQIMVGVFERVFEIGPVFRAEPHATVRHLAEYVSMDVELGFIDGMHDVVAVLREVLAGIVGSLPERHEDALSRLDVALPAVPPTLPAIDFEAAQELIERATGERVVGEPDLAPAHEQWLGDWAQREHGSAFLVVTGYPLAKRPFYTHPDPSRPGRSRSFDLLFRGTELVTGGQRLHRHEELVAAMQRGGIDTDRFAGYLEAFRFGMPPHGGFAIGLERLLAQLLGVPNIRTTTLFPRDRARCEP
jgi:nondiscriminating aspartyl-tRNA synthetase